MVIKNTSADKKQLSSYAIQMSVKKFLKKLHHDTRQKKVISYVQYYF